MPFVSVIIPTYNRASCIANAIESVLSQSYKDYELVVVDDGSTDETSSILSRYENKIRYIYQNNSGACMARNTGIRAANCKWIAFLDSDDEWLPEKLSIQMRDIESHPKAILHTTNATLVSHDGRCISLFSVTGLSRNVSVPRLIPRPLKHQIQYGLARLQCMIVQKHHLIQAGLFEEMAPMPIYEDQDLACRLALEGSWCVSMRSLTRIHRLSPNQDNLSKLRTLDPIRNAECLVRVYSKLAFDPRLKPDEKQLVNNTLSSYEGMLGMELLRAGKVPEGQSNLLQSMRHNISSISVLRCLLGYLPKPLSPAIARKWGALHD